MSNSSKSFLLSLPVIALFTLACATIQINVQINVGLTSTPTPDITYDFLTQSVPLQTPSVTSVPLTVTFTPTLEPMQRLQPGQPVQIGDLIMLSDTTGWGIEPWGHILHTIDGGRTWQDVTPPQNSYYRRGGFFANDPNFAWAISTTDTEIKSWQTSTAGGFWEAGKPIDLRNIDAGRCGILRLNNPSVRELYFLDSVKGWLVVSTSIDAIKSGPIKSAGGFVSMLFATTDAGSNWILKNLGTNDCSTSHGPEGLRSVFFWTPNDGWGGFFQDKFSYYPYNQERYVGGWDIYETQDAGQSWESVRVPEPPGFLEEVAKKENANENATCGIIQFTPFSDQVFGMQMRCFIPNTAFNYYYLTFNNGLDWNVWKATESEEFVVDAYADNKTTGWRFVTSEPGGLSQIQQTIDRGVTWTTIKKVSWNYGRFDFVDELVGWAIVTTGSDTLLLRTTNGGRTWKPLVPLVGS